MIYIETDASTLIFFHSFITKLTHLQYCYAQLGTLILDKFILWSLISEHIHKVQ